MSVLLPSYSELNERIVYVAYKVQLLGRVSSLHVEIEMWSS